jgi:hypothetical protein
VTSSGDAAQLAPAQAEVLWRVVAGVPALRSVARAARAAAASGVPMRIDLWRDGAAPSKVMSVSEYAKECNVVPRTVRRWIADGKVDGAVKTSNGWVIVR